jgi:hypothetical protein
MERPTPMNRRPASSSDIRSVGYDLASTTLEIDFHSGGVYQYSGVPETVYQGLMRATSKGSSTLMSRTDAHASR